MIKQHYLGSSLHCRSSQDSALVDAYEKCRGKWKAIAAELSGQRTTGACGVRVFRCLEQIEENCMLTDEQVLIDFAILYSGVIGVRNN